MVLKLINSTLCLLLGHKEQIYTHDIDSGIVELSRNDNLIQASIANKLFEAFNQHTYRSLKDTNGQFILNQVAKTYTVAGEKFNAKADTWSPDGSFSAQINDKTVKGKITNFGVEIKGRLFGELLPVKVNKRVFDKLVSKENSETTSPITGTVVKILCKPKQKVSKGDTLFVIESMKMEYQILASASGTVKEIFYKKNSTVPKGSLLCEID